MFRMRTAQSTYPVAPKEEEEGSQQSTVNNTLGFESSQQSTVNSQQSTVNNTVGFERIFCANLAFNSQILRSLRCLWLPTPNK
jgi:hypothetical protein